MRRAAMLVPVWCLRREGDLGIGDTTALRELIDWAAEIGLGILQVLPINETGGDHSPYNAISSVALEPALLDVSVVPGVEADQVAAARKELARGASLIEYEVVKKAKRGLLEQAFAQFWSEARDGEDWGRFEAFREAEAEWLEDYCQFRWLMDLEGNCESWDLWSMNYNTADLAREWIAKRRAARPDDVDRALAFPAWVQWHCFRQWRDLRKHAESQDVKLMGDLPYGISFASADVFFEPEWFDLKWSGGAPPETVFRDDAFAVRWGQNWGIPLYDWAALAKDRYSWWRRRVAKLSEFFHVFRIDHILGFYRIYAFPWRPIRNREFLTLSADEARARTGGRLPGFRPRPDESEEQRKANRTDGDRYLRMVLKAAGKAEVVGEDLGAVPAYVRPHLAQLGIAGFKICHWEVEAEEGGIEHPIPGDEYPELGFATYATHDHPAMAGMWEDFRQGTDSLDGDIRDGACWNLRVLSEFAGLPLAQDHCSFPPYDEEVKWKLLGALLGCRARYAAFMITDLFGLRDRFNVPATVGGSNWRIRLPFTLEEMRRRDDLREEAEKLRVLIFDSAR